MSHETPGAHLARLKTTYRGWQFWRGQQTNEFWAAPPPAHPQRELISAPDLPALEARVQEAERRREA